MEQNYYNGNNLNTENTGYTPTPEERPVQNPVNAAPEQTSAEAPAFTGAQPQQSSMNVPPYMNAQSQQNTYNGGYGYQQYNAAPVHQPGNTEKKSGKGKLAKVIALVAAVAIVGGGAGFGGAYLASSIGTSGTARPTASYNIDDQKQGSSSGRTENSDVSSALDAISSSGSEESARKVSASDIKPTGADGTYTADELYAAVNDTIVLINVYKDQATSSDYYYDYFFGYGRDDSGSEKSSEPVLAGYGSGIVFTEDGYILTNAHVVDGSTKLVVEVNDYENDGETHEYEAKVIGSDTFSDIAVIKIDRDEPFLAAKIGDSNTLKVGQEICVIGNPGVNAQVMFTHTLTKGIVSGLDVQCLAENGYSLSLIQTDAAINSGNSGGGMFDMYGNVVGVVNSKIVATTYEGIGFALTINEAKPIMEDLLSFGYVKSRPVLGITTIRLNEYRAQLYGIRLSKGLLVSAMNEGAPVENSGLQVYDVITKVNGKNVESVEDVQAIISKFKVGDTVTVTVARQNENGGMDSIEIDIELTESSNASLSR